jgi:sugar/nucleoside kinase (ribokinase family)
MSLTCVGSVAFDAVETPFGTRERMLGGSATHFSLAASFFTEVRVVGVVGDDFGDEELRVFSQRGVDCGDIERVVGGRTFFWRGRYDYDLNAAHTLDTQLNVFAEFDPKLSAASKSATTLFLGNIQPGLQRAVRSQCGGAALVALDSMNYWIETEREALVAAISEVDCVLLNDAEIRMLAHEPSLALAARTIRGWGPEFVVVKQGEYGAALFTNEGFFALPGYPLERVLDPTGAGDSFAGGFLGFLDAHAGEPLTESLVRRAMVYGSVLGSFNVEAFGTERMHRLTLGEIAERFDEFKRITHFEAIRFERAPRLVELLDPESTANPSTV